MIIREMASVVIAQLAASALQLRTLRCHLRKASSFPVFPNIKHLILDVRFKTFEDGIGPINAFHKLETLQLIAEPWGGDEMHLSDHFDCPVLDLTPLKCLRSISLERLTPKGILVCPGCILDVSLFCPADHLVWPTCSDLHSQGSLRSLQ